LDRKIRIGAVSYLNTKPLLYGLLHADIRHDIDLVLDYPAAIAKGLLEGSIDVGLVPVAIIPHLPGAEIISQYCIGCDGPVSSVCLFSEVPIGEIETVLLDYQSRTSVALLRILLRRYWKINPRLEDTTGESYLHRIEGKTAGLIIGDRALEMHGHTKYVYDLGEAWKAFAGLPFVFAAWISRGPVDPSFAKQFDAANAAGLEQLRQVIRDNTSSFVNLGEYYTRFISYPLDENKRKGLQYFLDLMKEEGI
jgi:chorismate dehydratase